MRKMAVVLLVMVMLLALGACEKPDNDKTHDELIAEMGDAFERIDRKFGYGTPSQVVGGIGIGGGINTAMNGLGGNGQSGKK